MQHTGYALATGYDKVTGIGSVDVGFLLSINPNNTANRTGSGSFTNPAGNSYPYSTSMVTTYPAQTGITYPAALTSNLNATTAASSSPVTSEGTNFYTATYILANSAEAPITTATILSAGTYILRDYFQPLAAYANSLNVASGRTTLVVNQATPTISNVTQTVPASGSPALGGAVTFVATVSGVTNGGTPTGKVQFYNGTAALGSPVTVDGTGKATLSTYTFTATGPASIKATYQGDTNYFSGATSATGLAITVVAPSLTITANPTSLTIKAGNNGTSTITFTPVGGYTGTATMACSGLPAYASCAFNPASLTFTGNGAVQTSVLTVYTLGPGGTSINAILWAPALMLGALLFFLRRRMTAMTRSLLMLAVLACMAFGVSGCGSTSFRTPAGTNAVVVNVTAMATAGSGSSNINQGVNISITIQ
jgi:hypothetical protein